MLPQLAGEHEAVYAWRQSNGQCVRLAAPSMAHYPKTRPGTATLDEDPLLLFNSLRALGSVTVLHAHVAPRWMR